jgi:putative ABC transport system permease protein
VNGLGVNTRGVLFLGLRYLQRNRAKTLLLVAAFTLVWLLPAGIGLIVAKVESQLRARAEGTPLLLGQAGSPLELVFNGIYFTKPQVATLPLREVDAVAETGLADVIPIYARYAAGGYRIVGTTLDYFDFRQLEMAAGRNLLRLGECVVGASVAEKNGLKAGDAVISTPETLFDLAGVYPLKMTVVGVLAPSASPDDEAIFVDLKTAWIIEGLGHGHDEAEDLGEEEKIAPTMPGDTAVRLNASVIEYNEITPGNAERFHFHGDVSDYPVTAAIILPPDARNQALIKGRYTKAGGLQLVSPAAEMDELFATVFSVQRFVIALLLAIGIATVAIGALVFLLSYRLREDEFRHLRHLGADLATLRALVAFEAGFVILASLIASGIGLALIHTIAPVIIREMMG